MSFPFIFSIYLFLFIFSPLIWLHFIEFDIYEKKLRTGYTQYKLHFVDIFDMLQNLCIPVSKCNHDNRKKNQSTLCCRLRNLMKEQCYVSLQKETPQLWMINRRMVYFHERNWTRPIASVPYLCRTHIPIRKLNSVNFAFVKWLRLQHFKNSIVLIWPCHKTSKQILIPLMLQSWNTVNVPNVLNCCLFFFYPCTCIFSDFLFGDVHRLRYSASNSQIILIFGIAGISEYCILIFALTNWLHPQRQEYYQRRLLLMPRETTQSQQQEWGYNVLKSGWYQLEP